MFDETVHIVPFGYEYERVLKPVEKGKADTVVLINNYSDEDVRTNFQEDVQEELASKPDVELEVRECDIFDMYDSMEAILETISDYSDEDVYVNLATGTKVTAVSGMIACMATDAEPFYVKSRIYGTSTPTKAEVPDYAGIVEVPHYPIEKPTDDQILVMEYMYDEGEMAESRVRKKDIIEFAKQRDLEFATGSEDISEKALYPRVNSHVIDPLREKGFIGTEERGNTTRVYLTDEGEKAVRAFRHVV